MIINDVATQYRDSWLSSDGLVYTCNIQIYAQSHANYLGMHY